MVRNRDRELVFEDIVLLRRAERRSPDGAEIAKVRLDLERMLGETVTVAFAARLIGVSHTTLRRWLEKGGIPAVIDVDGRRAVPVSSLVDLHEAVERERAAGKKHALEAAVRAQEERAARISPRALLWGSDEKPGPAGASESRGLAYHRAVARRLDRATADVALALLRHWMRSGSIDAHYGAEWEEILTGPLPGIRKAMEDESPRGRDLRQNSPFASLLTEAERQRILAEIGRAA